MTQSSIIDKLIESYIKEREDRILNKIKAKVDWIVLVADSVYEVDITPLRRLLSDISRGRE